MMKLGQKYPRQDSGPSSGRARNVQGLMGKQEPDVQGEPRA